MIATRFARIVSVVLHPILVPVYVLLLLFNLDSFLYRTLPLSYKLTMAGVALLTTTLFPLFLTWMLRRLGMISSYFMSNREERLYPVLVIGVFYYLTFYLLRGIHISMIFSYYMLGATLLAILTLGVNFFHKISLHMVALGSVAGLFLGLSVNFSINLTVEMLAAILLAGFAGFARLKENSHQPSEIYSGFLMGALIMTLVMVLL